MGLWLWLFLMSAWAARPTSGGAFGFVAEDTIAFWDDPSGRIRVTYSAAGPNQVRAGDADLDGTPDFAQEVASTAVEVLDFYAELGFREPLTEAESGAGVLGGSPAFDFYLVDFGGSADGFFGVDRCGNAPNHCGGFMVMENDFVDYGYPSISSAIEVLASHELFHAVQSAYDAGQPSWFGEGTAVWATQQFDPSAVDFLWFADEYLADAGRSLDRPPTGPVPAFSYGTALWWDFLTLRHEPSLIVDLLEGTETPDGTPKDTVQVMEDVLADYGDALVPAWTTFADANLATGRRSGAMETRYPYAEVLSGVRSESSGARLDEEHRFYPMAASYFRLAHEGGPLFFAAEPAAPDVRFMLHPVIDGAADGPVQADVARFVGSREVQDLGDLPRGGYWLVGTYPVAAEQSEKIRFCVGNLEWVDRCFPPVVNETPMAAEPEAGCGCASGGTDAAGAGVGVIAWVVAVRRRRDRSHRIPDVRGVFGGR